MAVGTELRKRCRYRWKLQKCIFSCPCSVQKYYNKVQELSEQNSENIEVWRIQDNVRWTFLETALL